MPTPLEPQSIDAIGVYGIIRQSEVDDKLIPEGAVTSVQNFHFDRKGAATVRLGLTGLGSTILTSRPCVSLHNAQQGTAISVFSNGGSATIYSFDGSSWSMTLDGGTASVAIRFLDFGSYTLALNFIYNTYTSIRFWNTGSSRHWHNTGNPINPQNMWGRACQLGEVFKSRIYLGDDRSQEGNRSRLYFSSVISSTGIITWSPTIDYVDVNPGDGEGMTGLKRYSIELCVFKPNYIYRFRTSGVDPDPLIKVGTRSHESIIEGQRGLYFHHDSGFYRYSGGMPVRISDAISDIVDAIPFSQYDDIISWNDLKHIKWSIGNVTVSEEKESVTWRNCVLVYTESSDIWTIYSYANEVRRGITYTRGTTLSRIIATDHGVVATEDSGNTDLGEPIKYQIRTKWHNFGSISQSKIINTLSTICEKAQTSILEYQINDELEWKTIGQLTKYMNFFRNQSIRNHRIRFKITGVSRFESMIFQGIEILEGINEGII